MNMLNFSKTVLTKVSFDDQLFEKELKKAINRLMVDEVEELQSWAFQQFPQLYPVLQRCFQGSFATYPASLVGGRKKMSSSAS